MQAKWRMLKWLGFGSLAEYSSAGVYHQANTRHGGLL
jgi:hypothetical protein